MTHPKPGSREAVVEQLTRPVCDALVVISGDQLLLDWASGRMEGPIDTKSVTKSVVCMVLGRLFQEGLLTDLDVSLARMLPAWNGTAKERITLRHVMSHTSGLDASASSEEVFASGDVVAFALETGLVNEPGSRFAYNNAAVNLLPAVIESVAGEAMDQVAAQLLFEPLGIRSWKWRRDAAGTPLAMSGCQLEARDLALLGQVMAHGGTWLGRQLLSPEWCRLTTAPAPPSDVGDLQRYLRSHGLLWWMLYPENETFLIDDDVLRAWREADPPMEPSVMQCLEPLVGGAYTQEALCSAVAGALGALTSGNSERALGMWHDNTWRRGLPDGRRAPGSEMGYFAQGARGQLLIVEPGRRRVVVQLVGEESTPAGALELLRAVSALMA